MLTAPVVLGFSCDSKRPEPNEHTAGSAGAFSVVPTQGGGNYRQQAVVDDALTYAAARSSQFQLLTTLPVEGNVYAQPLATTIANGSRDGLPVVLVATTENYLYAFEGQRPYEQLWRTSFGTPADFLSGSKPYVQNYANDVCRSNVGRVGILSTPVVVGPYVYLIAETEVSDTELAHTLYKVYVATGALATAPQRIAAAGHNSVFQSNIQLQRPGLLSSNGAIYAAFGSHCDRTPDDYRGWVMAFDPDDLHQLASYCTTCAAAPSGPGNGSMKGGIWMSGSGLATDSQGNVLFISGDGKSPPNDPGTTGTSIVSLRTAGVRSGTLDVGTYFTPADEYYETLVDADLGSSGPVHVPQGNLVYGGGKTGRMFLLDAANFGGFHNTTNSQIRDEIQASCNIADHAQPPACLTLDPPIETEPNAAVYGHIHGTPPYWSAGERLFVWGQGDFPRWKGIDTNARRFAGAGSNVSPLFLSSKGGTGGMLSLSTNAGGEAILWATYRNTRQSFTYGFSELVNLTGLPTGESTEGSFVAFRGDTLDPLIAPQPIAGLAKMTAPLVANGKVYVATFNGHVKVFGVDADTDGDGWPDGPDNCPTVFNPDQTDTNLEAERVAAAADGAVCADGTPPTQHSDAFYQLCFTERFPGDACDRNATTLLRTEDARLSAPSPCTIPFCDWRTMTCTQMPSTRNCATVSNAGIRFDSWIGSPDPFHPAPPAPGTSNPARCKCQIQPAPGDNRARELVRKCAFLARCDIGADAEFPEAGNVQDLHWLPMTIARRSDYPNDVFDVAGYFAPMTHLQPPVGDTGAAHFLWRFQADGPQASVLWGHVDTFTPGQGEISPDPALKHSYQWLAPLESTRPVMRFGNGVPRITLTWLPFGWSGGTSIAAPPQWLAIGLMDGATFPIAQVSREPEFVGTGFAPDALAALLPVAQRTAEVIVGDDVVWGKPFNRQVIPAVIVQRGTTTLLGALQANGGAITSFSKCISSSGFCDPPAPRPDLRVLAAWDGTLFSLHADRSGAQLTQIDVRSALANVPISFTMDVFDAAPSAPLSMAWHFAERALYVLDAMPIGRQSALRLLRLEPSGRSVELWRTRGVGSLPAAFVSVDLQGDVVVSLRADAAEFVAVGRTGVPRVSKHVDGRLKQAVIGAMSGFSIPLDAEAHDSSSDLRVTFVGGRGTVPGVCGAPWLRSHADHHTPNPLSVAATACAEREDEEHEGRR